MKKINFNLAKRLNELGLLDNIKTEYAYNKSGWLWDPFYKKRYIYKTLTTEEAVEFLKNEIWIACDFSISNRHNIDWCIMWNFESPEPNLYFEWETLLETIEKLLEHLIDKNLIWHKQ